MNEPQAVSPPSARKPVWIVVGLVVVSVVAFASYNTFAGAEGGGTAEACRGGLISYSKETRASSSETGGNVDVDLGKLKTKLDDAAKRSHDYEEVVANDPDAQRAAHACWQVCQAWASTKGREREALFSLFQDCLKRPKAASIDSAPLPVPTVTQSAGSGAVQIVGTGNSVTLGAPAPSTSK